MPPSAARARAVVEEWHQVAGRPVRSLRAEPERSDGGPEVVVVPGLGAVGYLVPFVRALGRRRPARLLDVPGFGHRRTARSPSTLQDVATVVSAWLSGCAPDPVVLVGHSTGAQAALRAAVATPDAVAALVLAGPTFPPSARTWRGLAAATVRTARHESPRIVRAAGRDYLRGGRRVATLLRTGLRDAPEDLVGRVPVPLGVLRGVHDQVCPAAWTQRLAATAPDGRAVTLAGAHNFCFQLPDLAAEAVLAVSA